MTTQIIKASVRVSLFCAALAACLLAHATTPKVITVAGGYVGNGIPATSASFATPIAVVVDASGDIYISDTGNCRIRKINKKGVIDTFAGTGICGYSGDGRPARSAMMSGVFGMAFDSQRNLVVAELNNNRVRRITPSGIITTIAGNGTSGYSGDGGPATQATLAGPEGVSVDTAGDVYIADSVNYVVRMVDTAGIIHTVAGNHIVGFSGDGGPATSASLRQVDQVVLDGSGGFYIADSGRVRRVDSSGTITTYAGNGSSGNTGNGGPATSASIASGSIALLVGSGRLYISTFSNIWAVDSSTQNINIIAGDSTGIFGFNGDGNTALSTEFSGVWGMAFDSSGNLLVADSSNNRVRRIDPKRIVTTIAGGYIGDGERATAASLNLGSGPAGKMAFDSAGNLYIADSYDNRVRKVTPTGGITTVAGTGISGYSGDGGPATFATLNFPRGVAADHNGNIFISDGSGIIRKVDNSGIITTFFSNPQQIFIGGGLAIDVNDNLYFADGLYAIWKVTPSGSSSIVAGVLFNLGYNGDGIPATQALLLEPTGVAVDSAGNLFIADWLNGRVRKVDTSGIISTVAGTGTNGYNGDGIPATTASLFFPIDVAVDGKGNLYIADWINFRVRVVDASGTIKTLTGTGNFGYNGNYLPAAETNFLPISLAVSPHAEVYVSDGVSFRVRRIH